jgi:hypothetical protein
MAGVPVMQATAVAASQPPLRFAGLADTGEAGRRLLEIALLAEVGMG